MSYLDGLEATAETPDGKASASVRGREQVSFSLAPGYFEQASPADLERQMSRLARLLFAARMRAYYRLRSIDFDEEVRREPSPVDKEDHEYVEARSRLLAEGGVGGPVEITCVGMSEWHVRIDRQRFGGLDEASFCAAVGQAASQLIDSQLTGSRRLKNEIYV